VTFEHRSGAGADRAVRAPRVGARTVKEATVQHVVPPPPAVRGRGAATRRAAAALALLLVAGFLAACQGTATNADAWTEAQLAGVFDLAELGRELTVAPSGDHLVLDGRALPPALLERFPHLTMGRSSNLLRLGDDALEALSPTARDFLLRAAPGELRERLDAYGLDLATLRAAWGEAGAIDLVGLHAVAEQLDRSGVRSAAGGVGHGTRLLVDLGVGR
jgi:hypothetical protein